MADTYETLDKQIVAAIVAKPRCDLWDVRLKCSEELQSIADKSGRHLVRILDGRLQALRKKGVIEYVRTDGHRWAGWVVKEARNG